MTKTRVLRTAVAAAFALAAAITAATPAAAQTRHAVQASPASTTGTTGTISRFTPVPAGGQVSCYGYYGTFKAGSHVMVVDWTTASDECFGIATDRTIWHTWPGANGWHRLPGDGHADDVTGIMAEITDPTNLDYGWRGVVVHADTNNTNWYQMYELPGGWTGQWSELG